MEQMMDGVPRIHPDTGVARVGDRLVAAGPDDFLHAFEDGSGQVSEVAERIVELVDGERTVAQIVEALCAEFEVDSTTCATDTVAFIRLLVERRVLTF